MKVVLLALVLLAGPALAQTTEGQRGSTPPGTARDGSRPDEGAIRGGTILPGERAGMPERPGTMTGVERCKELSGTLREDCLKQQRRAGVGATRPPNSPPPQNPR